MLVQNLHLLKDLFKIEKRLAIDGTLGRRTRSVIVLDSNHIVLSALQPDTISARINGKDLKLDTEDRLGEESL